MSPLAILAIVFVVLTIMGVPLFVAVGLRRRLMAKPSNSENVFEQA